MEVSCAPRAFRADWALLAWRPRRAVKNAWSASRPFWALDPCRRAQRAPLRVDEHLPYPAISDRTQTCARTGTTGNYPPILMKNSRWHSPTSGDALIFQAFGNRALRTPMASGFHRAGHAVCAAGAGALKTSLANLRKFCAAAASVNSSCAPVRSTQPQAVELQDGLQKGKQHLDFFSVAA